MLHTLNESQAVSHPNQHIHQIEQDDTTEIGQDTDSSLITSSDRQIIDPTHTYNST